MGRVRNLAKFGERPLFSIWLSWGDRSLRFDGIGKTLTDRRARAYQTHLGLALADLATPKKHVTAAVPEARFTVAVPAARFPVAVPETRFTVAVSETPKHSA